MKILFDLSNNEIIKTYDEIIYGIKGYSINQILDLKLFENVNSNIIINLDNINDYNELANELLIKYNEQTYSFDRFKSIKKVKYNLDFECQNELDLNRGTIISKVINNTKDLISTPHNFLGTNEYINYIKDLINDLNNPNVKLEILDKEEIKKLNMNAFLAVNKGSKDEAKLVHITFNNSNKENICLIGKGIMFDTGGYSIKPSDSMKSMKKDMAGSATVLGVFEAAVRLNLNVNLSIIMALTDNMISNEAYKVDDILVAMNNKSIEVHSTDAEGRLTLADALCYANYKGYTNIIDIATLTGGVMVALGLSITGLFSNDDLMVEKLLESAKEANELIWRLPISKEAEDMIKDSKVADLKNSTGRYASSISAAAFLKEFINDKTKWAHFDIAGTAAKNGIPTAVLLKTLLNYIEK